MRIVFPWIFYCFIGYVSVEQFYLLLDRVVGMRSLEIVPLYCVSLLFKEKTAILEAESQSLDLRLEAAKRLDPMRHVLGKTSLESAIDQTRTLIRELDEHLCAAAESARAASRTVARTHPKDIQ